MRFFFCGKRKKDKSQGFVFIGDNGVHFFWKGKKAVVFFNGISLFIYAGKTFSFVGISNFKIFLLMRFEHRIFAAKRFAGLK